jgi:hypothetical protein
VLTEASVPGSVIDDLHADVLQTALHGQPGTFRGPAHPVTHMVPAALPPHFDLFLLVHVSLYRCLLHKEPTGTRPKMLLRGR